MIGLQIGAQVNDEVSVTALFVAKGEDDYEVEAELAYLTYAIDDSWDIRAGRLRVPFFYYSDFLDVGIAYPWIRPPEEVYRTTFNSFEGIDTVYRGLHGSWSSTWHLFYGSTDRPFGNPEDQQTFYYDNLMGFNIIFGNDWLTLRGGYLQTDVELSTLSSGLGEFYDTLRGVGFGAIADELDFTVNNPADYVALAVNVDYQDWLLNVEYTQIGWDRTSVAFNDKAWFVMGGHRFDDITVHLTYAVKTDDPVFEVNTIPVGVNPQLDALAAGVNSLFANEEQKSITAGIRYDLGGSMALKFDVTRFDSEVAEPLFAGQPAPQEDGTLVSIGLDLVF